ncbi:MAG: hypothetical protein HETSPECPRED_000993 [Heterodermia speciosa]|uniref:FAD/NAD(P)-binding domain-containing protein n=1 Tax=Heterodermia speciosa TaxID=116794 RepID=A0A8H3G814_9LECA|nr:MAG: hypothetical protein HETSPECPRED_000993 [Heterodermia speciosa]
MSESDQVIDPACPVDYPKSKISLTERFIDEPRPLRVAVIGGGIAGILAGILLPVKVPNIDLVIYEKSQDVGGTWLENVYPGVRCDIPAHVYQSTFAPNTQWSEQFANGAEIREYWQGLARRYNVYDKFRLNSKVEDVSWDGSHWNLKIQGNRLDKVDFVLSAIGKFNAWKLPNIPEISDYKGHLRHTSNWDPSFDPKDKTVAVIGNGASGIQVVSNLQKSVKRLDHYARNKTWIATSWAGDERTFDSQPYSEELKKSFEDPEKYLEFRKKMEDKYWRRFGTLFRGSEANETARRNFTKAMKERLNKKPELFDQILPDFSANCRRPTPGPGYLEAISEDNVHYITTPIKRFTSSGIETEDGIRDVDAVFCATGANTDLAPPFPITAYGVDLASAWKSDGLFTFPYTYFGLATPGFPNLLFIHGPHGTGASGTLPQALEIQLTYYAKLLRKVSKEGIKAMVPSKKAADDFIEYCDAFFPRTVLTDNCSSWYNSGKPGSRIHGLWPGSGIHVTTVRREPRWEDWEYEYLSGNRFEWYLGNGWTKKERDLDSDATSYLKLPSEIDLRDLHESWWNIP